VRIAVGLLPYISIASVWQQRRPVIKDLAASRHRLCIDTSLCRTVALAELANAIPRSSYLFGVSWPDVRRTLLVAVEQNGDPYAIMICGNDSDTGSHSLLLCAFDALRSSAVLGGYNETFSAGRSGLLQEGVVKVHLCSEVGFCPDSSAPSAGRPKGARRAREPCLHRFHSQIALGHSQIISELTSLRPAGRISAN
jgi:hypothetical protein